MSLTLADKFDSMKLENLLIEFGVRKNLNGKVVQVHYSPRYCNADETGKSHWVIPGKEPGVRGSRVRRPAKIR